MIYFILGERKKPQGAVLGEYGTIIIELFWRKFLKQSLTSELQHYYSTVSMNSINPAIFYDRFMQMM